MEYGATVWDPYQKYNSDKVERLQRRAARFVKSRYSRYSSVFDMLDVLGWTPLSQKRQEARLILFYKVINGLAQVPFEGHWLYLDQIFFKIIVHPFRIIPMKGPAEY